MDGAAHASYRCAACEVSWRPSQVDHGRCPMCGAASARTPAPASDDADLLYRIARAEAEHRVLYATFDRYYVGLEQPDRDAA